MKAARVCMIPALFVLVSLSLASARSQTTVLTFEGLQDSEAVNNYYNGGFGSKGSGPGPNYGIMFSANSLALVEGRQGGTGNFGGEPSPDTVLFFLVRLG